MICAIFRAFAINAITRRRPVKHSLCTRLPIQNSVGSVKLHLSLVRGSSAVMFVLILGRSEFALSLDLASNAGKHISLMTLNGIYLSSVAKAAKIASGGLIEGKGRNQRR